MRKAKAWMLIVLSAVLLLAGCSSDPVEEDANHYFKEELPKVASLEQEIMTQFSNMSQTLKDPQALYQGLNDQVLPRYEAFVKELEKIKPATKEVQEVHEKYLSATRAQQEAFQRIVNAMKDKDKAGLTAAREKLEEARTLIKESKEGMKQLALGYGIQL
ncbi:hypothetical protein [Brevibacillus panacihumi]|uniref:Lipoprotein n=1 Tax=Brevibacillus panacihumi TaxID=497735 RepID=A0A3M8CVJ0_9BACL|nr:hypothetical protein [Brevibacillus panacihumi]RNB79267.1 hypothetical protein EDM58_09830 [Brevibacillus panacihumi]